MAVILVPGLDPKSRKRWGLADDDPGPVSLPKMQLETRRVQKVVRKGKVAPSPNVPATARSGWPRNERWVLVNGRFHENPNFNPRFNPTLGQAIFVPAAIGAGAAAAATLLPMAAAKGMAAASPLLSRLVVSNGARRGLSTLERNARDRQDHALANYWAEPNPRTSRGEHVAPVRWGKHSPFLAKLIDSRFNVLKPKGITRGGMAELHHACDNMYSGGKLPRRVNLRGWSAKKEGLEKYGPLRWAWDCTTPAMKGAAGVAGLAGGGVIHKSSGEEERGGR